MRLLCLNVALFEENNDKLSDFLSKYKFDILCFQEVSEKIDKSAKSEYVSKSHIDNATSSLRYQYFSPNIVVRECHLKNFHKIEHFDYDFGGRLECGNYIKSSFKIVDKSNVHIVDNKISEIVDENNTPENLTRKFQIADLEMPNSKKLRLINYHGIWSKDKKGTDKTKKACEKILKAAKEANYPVIIAGDFNLFPDSPSMKVFNKDFISLVDLHEIITTRPKSNELSQIGRNVVDYILVSKDIKINSFEVLSSDVSDHLPLVLDFRL